MADYSEVPHILVEGHSISAEGEPWTLPADAKVVMSTEPRMIGTMNLDVVSYWRCRAEKAEEALAKVHTVWTGSNPDRTKCAMCFSPYVQCTIHGGA